MRCKMRRRRTFGHSICRTRSWAPVFDLGRGLRLFDRGLCTFQVTATAATPLPVPHDDIACTGKYRRALPCYGVPLGLPKSKLRIGNWDGKRCRIVQALSCHHGMRRRGTFLNKRPQTQHEHSIIRIYLRPCRSQSLPQ